MTRTKTEDGKQRSTVRYDFPSTIEYRLEPPSDGTVYKAVTINISSAGLAAYVFDGHPEGQRITILSPLPVERSQATLRWIRKEDEDFFVTGMHFTDAAET